MLVAPELRVVARLLVNCSTMSEQLMTQALQEMLMHVFTNPYPEQKWKGWLALEQTFGVPVEFNLITNVRLSAACKELRTYEGVKEAIYKMMESEPDYITFVKLRKFKSAWPVYVDKLSSVVRSLRQLPTRQRASMTHLCASQFCSRCVSRPARFTNSSSPTSSASSSSSWATTSGTATGARTR